ncbi:uncharacterized protein V6R79_000168 [Siganus canaliculatus]
MSFHPDELHVWLQQRADFESAELHKHRVKDIFGSEDQFTDMDLFRTQSSLNVHNLLLRSLQIPPEPIPSCAHAKHSCFIAYMAVVSPAALCGAFKSSLHNQGHLLRHNDGFELAGNDSFRLKSFRFPHRVLRRGTALEDERVGAAPVKLIYQKASLLTRQMLQATPQIDFYRICRTVRQRRRVDVQRQLSCLI